MKTVVYIDVYFVLNFAVDLLCIYLCGMLSGRRPKKLNLIASALIGGAFSKHLRRQRDGEGAAAPCAGLCKTQRHQNHLVI